jgi:hypothetical protein
MKAGSSLSWMWMLSRGDRGKTGTGCWAVLSKVSVLLILYIESLDVQLWMPLQQTALGNSLSGGCRAEPPRELTTSRRCNRPASLIHRPSPFWSRKTLR